MTFHREKEMHPFVSAWLQGRGLRVSPKEHWLCGGYCDVVGYEFAARTSRAIPPLLKLIAVELKLGRINEVYKQAEYNGYAADESWAAMPEDVVAHMKERTVQMFRSNGIGLLGVSDSGRITASVLPKVEVFNHVHPSDQRDRNRRRVWKTLWRVARAERLALSSSSKKK